ADIRIKERHHLKAGLGLRQSIVQSSGSLPGSESNTFSMDALPKSGFNPYLMTAYQKELRLFHQRLSCSIEYNLGFFPFTQQLQTLSSASRYNQGLFVGLRYSF
ncbi:MAG TPA: hypothetical protein PLP14_01960, partial [Chitinophagaceae bacterium]|nr:hypothetical protein [Chitinophagaceae bacterium]